MLTTTTARRSAAVLMVALVAALLVVTGGSSRAAQTRLSAGSGQAGTVPQIGRHVASLPSSSDHLAALYLDLASTPPADVAAPVAARAEHVDDATTLQVSGDDIAAVVRGPPTA